MSDLLSTFNEQFELIAPVPHALLDEVFRLRYQVFCCQAKVPDFEACNYPNGRETDDYDRHSTHCLLRHRATGKPAGCVRLVLADPNLPSKAFPVERAARNQFNIALCDPDRMPRQTTAEISRLIIPRAPTDTSGAAQLYHHVSAFPFPVLGLLAGVMRLSHLHTVTHLYASMEPLLNRLLRRFSLHFTPITPIIEHHGRRQAHLGVVAQVMGRAYRERREVWDLLTDRGRFLPVDGSWELGIGLASVAATSGS